MKILHIIDSGGLYGAEIMLLSLMQEQEKCGHTSVLCSITDRPEAEKAVVRAARKKHLTVKVMPMRPGFNLPGAMRIIRYGKEQGFDVFHLHGYKPNILLGLLPRFMLRTPLISTCHGWTNTRARSKLAAYEWLDVKLLKRKDAVVLVSRKMLALAKIQQARIPPSRLHVVNNGVSEKEPDAQQNEGLEKQIRHFADGAFLLGSIGRLSEEKGFTYLLQALHRLRTAGEQVKLVLVGDGPLLTHLQNEVSKLALQDAVLFTGYLHNARSCISLFNVYTISSLTEGLPITLLEAMYEKTPLVCTRVGGIPDVISSGENGLLVDRANAQQLAEAIKFCIDNPEKTHELAENAARHVREHYSCQRMAGEYEHIYKQAIAARSS